MINKFKHYYELIQLTILISMTNLGSYELKRFLTGVTTCNNLQLFSLVYWSCNLSEDVPKHEALSLCHKLEHDFQISKHHLISQIEN